MKSALLPSAVIAVAALTSTGASAELLNQWLFEQIKAPSVRTRADVRAEVSQPQQEAKPQATRFSTGAEKADSMRQVATEAGQTK